MANVWGCLRGLMERIAAGTELDDLDPNSSNKRKSRRSLRRHSEGVDLFRDYCENATIHGVKYLGKPKQRGMRRLWWIIAFLMSIGISTYAIIKLCKEWNDKPVIVSFSENITPVRDIPFPAGNIIFSNTQCF